MKKNIHPKYSYVIFADVSSDLKILTKSTLTSSETEKWSDGNSYPIINVEVSSASHPFYTGSQKLLDSAGRIDKFKKKYKVK